MAQQPSSDDNTGQAVDSAPPPGDHCTDGDLGAGKPAGNGESLKVEQPAAGKKGQQRNTVPPSTAPANGAPLAKALPAAKLVASGGKLRKSGRVRPAVPVVVPREAPPASRWRSLATASPPWFTSMVVHAVILLVLGFITLAPKAPSTVADLVVSTAVEPREDLPQTQQETSVEREALLDTAENFTETTTAPALTADSLPPIEAPDAADDPGLLPSLELADLDEEVPGGEALLAPLTGGGGDLLSELSTRTDEAARKTAVVKRGGSPESEAAVEAGLEWLAKHQDLYGSWSFDHRLGPCQGRCGDPGVYGAAKFGATGMALLPFLGAGQTHKTGKYKEQIRLGLFYLVQNMRGGSMFEQAGQMYSHGLATIALCEAYAMTQDPRLKEPAQAAINYIVETQDPKGGGWRDLPRTPGDTSVVGWQVMALKSGHMAYLIVPPRTVAGADNFLNVVQSDGGATYGYVQSGVGTQATTAVGLLCRMYLGWPKETTALKQGVELLASWGPSLGKSDMYYNYYATQVLHHWEGPLWSEWNRKLRDHLIKTQNQKKGHAKGSWYFEGGDLGSEAGGRLYTTAMATMTLEVYYRYMPLYRQQSTDDGFGE